MRAWDRGYRPCHLSFRATVATVGIKHYSVSLSLPQLQLEEEQMIRNKAANATALAAIKKRKRPAVDGMVGGNGA